MKSTDIKISPSILSADFAKMGEEIVSLEKAGADMIHCDVMDGIFVPNLSFGMKMVSDIRKRTRLLLDVHLMIVHPERYVERFAEAGADFITVHYEACRENLAEVLSLIKSCGVKCGCAINPDCDPNNIKDIIPFCDMVLVMGVFPGFGGQTFIRSALDSLRIVRAEIEKSGRNILLEIDGGVTTENCAEIKAAGADVLVSGSTVFKSPDRLGVIRELREKR